MFAFPQLQTGSMAQLPSTRGSHFRTIGNSMGDGSSIKLEDFRGAHNSWTLRFRNLSDAEFTQLGDFFSACEGQLRSFTFLDPFTNLLRWSEQLSETVWHNDGGLSVGATGLADPEGTARASQLVNTAQVAQGLRQTIDAPGNYIYCFSAYVKAAQPCSVGLAIETGQPMPRKLCAVSSEWSRVYFSASGEEADQVTGVLEVPAGTALSVYGLQLEAQPNPSPYVVTQGKSGVFAHTRFAQDQLTFVAQGPDSHDCTVRLQSRDEDSNE